MMNNNKYIILASTSPSALFIINHVIPYLLKKEKRRREEKRREYYNMWKNTRRIFHAMDGQRLSSLEKEHAASTKITPVICNLIPSYSTQSFLEFI